MQQHGTFRRVLARLSAHERLVVILVAAIFFLLRFLPFIVGQTLFFGDNYSLMVPGKLFTASWLDKGILPLWNPLLFAGITWIGDINQSIWYPSTLLFWWFSPATAFNTTVLLQLTITFVGAYWLARRLSLSQTACYLVALLWSCSPQIASSVNNLATLQTLSFLPWIVWAGLSTRYNVRFSVCSGLLVALQLLGGYPQYVLYAVVMSFTLSLAGQWSVLRSSSKKIWWFVRSWLLAGSIALGVSAVAWLPFLPTVANSTRVVQSLDQAAAGSLAIGELVHVVLPTFFYNPAAGIKWGFLWTTQPNVVVYFGWFGLLLLGSSLLFLKRAALLIRTLWAVVVISLLFAFGAALPWFYLFAHVPLLSAARGASGILQLTALAGALLVGWSFDQVKPKNTLRWRYFLWAVTLLAVLATLGWLAAQTQFSVIWQQLDEIVSGRLSLSPFHTLERDALIVQNALRVLVTTSVSLALSVYFWQRKKQHLLLACVALDVVLNTSSLFFFAPREIYATDPRKNDITTLLRDRDLTQYRVLMRNYNTPYTDLGAYWDALAVRSPFSDSYIDATELTKYSHLQRMRAGATPDWNMVFAVPVINGYTTLLPRDVDQRFATSDATETSINNLPEIPLSNQALADWSVAYYVRDAWFPLYDAVLPEEVLAETTNLVLYHLPAQPRIRWLSGEPLPLFNIHETPNELSFITIATQSADLLIADRYDKNWRATINGAAVEIINQAGMRRMSLEQGTNNVRLWYEPRAFYLGLGISGITLLLSLMSLRLRRPKI